MRSVSFALRVVVAPLLSVVVVGTPFASEPTGSFGKVAIPPQAGGANPAIPAAHDPVTA
jgi:hypothetical protein